MLSFLVLGAIGVYFAVKGIKAAQNCDEKRFVSMNRLENLYDKCGKERVARTLLYMHISSDNLQGVASEADVLSEIKMILLRVFSVDEISVIASCGEKSFAILTQWDADYVSEQVELLQNEFYPIVLIDHA